MANELKGIVTYTDETGKEWKLSFPNDVLISLEDATGISVLKFGAAAFGEDGKMKDRRTFILHALKKHQPDATEAMVDGITSFGATGIITAALDAFRLAFTAPDEAAKPATENPK